MSGQVAVTVCGAEPLSELVLWFPGERDKEQWALADASGFAHFQVSPVALGPQLVMFEQWTGSMEPPASIILIGQ